MNQTGIVRNPRGGLSWLESEIETIQQTALLWHRRRNPAYILAARAVSEFRNRHVVNGAPSPGGKARGCRLCFRREVPVFDEI
jgi:hypothetical protein